MDKNGQVSYKFIFLISVIMAFVSQIRPNGIFIVLILLIVLGIYLFKKNQKERFYAVLPALTIIFILLIASLNVAYDVEDNQKDAVFTKVAHMLADYDLNHELSSQDQAKVHQMMDEKTIKEKYSITYSDPIWGAANEQVYDNNKGTYIGMAIGYSLKDPIHFIQYLFGSSPMVWDVTRDSDWIGSVYKTDINNANRFFYSNNKTPAAEFDGLMAKNSNTEEYKQINSIVYSVKDNIVTDSLFDSPALYMYLAIILMVAIQFITKSKNIYVMYLPNFLNILIVFLSTPIQDNRYLYPNLLLVYLLAIILISLLLNNENTTSVNTQSHINSDNNADSEDYYVTREVNIHKQNPTNEETQEEMEAIIRAKILKELEQEK